MSNYLNDIKMPELLAPAGGKRHLVEAVNNGADAVYMGGSVFNARIFADNFTQEELPEAIEFAHAHDVRVYITFNTLISDEELPRALEYANFLYSAGADALIVQDMGLARLVRKYLPDFPLHLSTQGTVYNAEALPTVREIGFTRVVPARELSLEEIRTFCKAASDAGIETEVFVHGALCMCYSGQCQMSRGLSSSPERSGLSPNCGRSGNRGTCAQPCRQLYKDDKGEYGFHLSPKDICQIESLPALIEAGVDSFKIEGRIKTPEYVAAVTKIYRKYIDLYAELRRFNDAKTAAAAYSVSPEDIQTLRQAFNRGGFSSGYLYGNPGSDILSGPIAKNRGLYLGRVLAVIDSEEKAEGKKDKAAVRGALRRGKVLVCVKTDETDILNGDGVEFHSRTPRPGSQPIGTVATYVSDLGGGLRLIGDLDPGVRIGDEAYKVTDAQFAARALSTPAKKLPVTCLLTAREGQHIELEMTDMRSGCSVCVIGDHIVEKAMKTPTEADLIAGQLQRLGDTPFVLSAAGCDVALDEGVMVPVSVLNRLRREASSKLYEERLKMYVSGRRPLGDDELSRIISEESLGKDRLNCTRPASGKLRKLHPVPLELFMKGEYEIPGSSVPVPYILNVSKGVLDEYIRANFDAITGKAASTGIMVGNPGWIDAFQKAGARVYGDYGLNVCNRQAEKLWEELGVTVYAPSHETGISDFRGLPLMITEHPIESSYLTDRKGVRHRVEASPSGDKYLIY